MPEDWYSQMEKSDVYLIATSSGELTGRVTYHGVHSRAKESIEIVASDHFGITHAILIAIHDAVDMVSHYRSGRGPMQGVAYTLRVCAIYRVLDLCMRFWV